MSNKHHTPHRLHNLTVGGGSRLVSTERLLPGRLAVAAEVLELETSDRQPDDGSLVELARDGARKRQHLRQLVELIVLLASSRARRVT